MDMNIAQPVQSVTRALQIMRVSGASEAGLTVAEIAQAVGISRPTAHNLIATLVAERFLMKLEKPTRYRLGPELSTLLTASDLGYRRSAARELLAEESSRYPDAGFVYGEAGADEIRIIWRTDFKRSSVVERVDREVSHPYDTASALIFHAFANEPQAMALRKRFTFEEYGLAIWGSRKHFEDCLAEVLHQGYSALPASGHRELSAVAAPVWGRGGGLVGAFGAFWPGRPEQVSAYIQASREGAEKLSLIENPQ